MRETKFEDYDNLFKFTHIPNGIKKLEIFYYTIGDQTIWNEICCEFENLNSDIASKFLSLDCKVCENCITLSHLENHPLKVIEFLSRLDSIDPLPNEVWQFLENMGFKILKVPNPLDQLPNHEQALRVAIEADKEGFHDQFIVLANHYSGNDLQNWLRVLNSIPENNRNFTAAQEQVLNYFNDLKIIFDKNESIQRRFEVAFKLKHSECDNLFSLLCDEPEFSKPTNLRGDYLKTLNQMAESMKRKNSEIEKLKNENETLKENSCQSHHGKHGFEMFKRSR